MSASSSPVVRVAVIEDHPVMREATVRFLAATDGLAVVCAAPSIEEFLASAPAPLDVLVLDLHLPGLSGFEGLPPLRARCPTARVLVLTMSDDAGVRESMRAAGVEGFLTKGCAPTELVDAVRRVARGEMFGLESPAVTRVGSDPVPLTAAEVEVLRLLVASGSVGDIATQLGVSFRQGALIIDAIKQKTGGTSRAEWLRYALDHELL